MTDDIDTFGNDQQTAQRPDIDWTNPFSQQLLQHLEVLYPGVDQKGLARGIIQVCDRYPTTCRQQSVAKWSEQDVVLICYGDNIFDETQPTLDVLSRFLLSHEIDSLINIVHLLPINPYTSDDGFSVVDYRSINERLGNWGNVDALNEHFDLMLDLVLNHCSQESQWFQKFLERQQPFTEYFIEADPNEDYSAVVRPRNLPLLSEKQTIDGPCFVWTTFSEDQVDLNFACPDVLLEFIDILLLYASHGARIIRLDAIAYLWKQLGTNCIHLPQTHEVVKLMRTIVEQFAPSTLLLTETNVPHAENISYFGAGDEAQMVYQFSLPPLILDAYLQQDGTTMANWLKTVCDPLPGTTFFNFTASHDGIGVRPLEGLVHRENLDQLVAHAVDRGGKIGLKQNADGSSSPYELNITFLDMLLTEPDSQEPGIDRFMSSQAIMLSIKGIPGIYFHSLFGTRNDLDAAKESQIPRRINRRKFESSRLGQRISETGTVPQRAFSAYRKLLEIRQQQSAFHPDARQVVVDQPNPQLLMFQRLNQETQQQVTVIANFSAAPQTVQATQLPTRDIHSDLISGRLVENSQIEVTPFGIVWLA